jgi:hypothetical protein
VTKPTRGSWIETRVYYFALIGFVNAPCPLAALHSGARMVKVALPSCGRTTKGHRMNQSGVSGGLQQNSVCGQSANELPPKLPAPSSPLLPATSGDNGAGLLVAWGKEEQRASLPVAPGSSSRAGSGSTRPRLRRRGEHGPLTPTTRPPFRNCSRPRNPHSTIPGPAYGRTAERSCCLADDRRTLSSLLSY